MKAEKVSVIVPCFNQASFLDDALKSVIQQTYKNWECIIVDDGSTDETKQVGKRWSERDQRFKYFFKRNGGLSSARNYGLDRAKGSFIQFLDSDDIIFPKKLETAIALVSGPGKEGSSIAISNFRIFSKTKEETSDPYCTLAQEYFNYQDLLVKWPVLSIPIHCGLFDIRLFDQFRFPEDLKAFEDWIMWLHLLKSNPSVSFIDLPLALYRRHGDSMTGNFSFMDENLRKAIPHIKKIASEKEYIYYSFKEMQERNIELKRLQRKINDYENSRTFRFLQNIKKNWLGKLSFRILKKI
ncbi:hypothetical protein SAMN04488034_10424 [Salinimicrobium catena]|uniref:Glycosyltransferase 2-like domain-containing protein n=1 Tax=Salinimicrobium catena TaxID=390640 RepID=A0A1H5NAX6_9FLAO|nr:glycosyltransferase [Salinimicrobium catena]SDL41412.1 hypothetical protein SAMN04488140_10424 [Salinimicrobium catena]SEE98674.1 hypothetical protein SAMN04488034_10424 [Salinimicrobium catena]